MRIVARHVQGLLLLAGVALLAPASVFAGIRVVSDIDDTAKISNTDSMFNLMLNSLFSTRAFTGMKELYSSFAFERGYEFDYVTAAPFYWKGAVEDFLWENGFPKGEVHVRSAFKSESRIVFKTRILRELLAEYPDDRFIFLGDDTAQDVATYDDLYRYAPDRVIAIYIRKIKNKPLPPSEYGFLTAFDIARSEYLMDRLEVVETSPVALAVLSETEDRRIIPRFSYCPAKKTFRFTDPKVEQWSDRVSKRVQTICKKRKYPDEIL